jgi:hypothetical protein
MTLPQISLAELPDGSLAHMDFLDSSWFTTHGGAREFPTPQHVRSFSKPPLRPHVVKFEDLNLIVKFGPDISTLEAVNLWAVRRAFGNVVPVPEVYGWRVVEREGKSSEVFIYMQITHGPTLEQRWTSLSATEKQTIISDLRAIASRFRGLQDNEPEQVIGKPLFGCVPLALLNFKRFDTARPSAGSLPREPTSTEAIPHSGCVQRLAFLAMAPSRSRSTEHRRSMERSTSRQWIYRVYAWRSASSQYYRHLYESCQGRGNHRLGAGRLVSGLLGVLQGYVHD